jgi:LPS-assembly protein
MSTEWNGLSDDNYIVDLGSDFYNRADTHLSKTISLTYNTDDLDIHASIKDFELIGERPSAYRTLPEVKLDYAAWRGDYLKLDVHSEFALFDNAEGDLPQAARLHVAPTLSLPFNTPWAEFLAETSILHTTYHQKDTENTQFDENVSRTLGQVRLYGSVAFEKQADWFGENATQTLEPKIQYLYTSYENQDNIGFYDTTRLLNDYDGLFRGQEFTGLDRISDKNQLTLGVTTRLMDGMNREQLRLSLGQIFYFENNRILEADRNENNRSAIAGELEWNITSRWRTEIEAQVSSENEQVERSSVSLEYRESDNRSVQLGHRYVRDLSGVEINQAGITVSWDVAQNWQWVGRYYRDLDLHRTTETFTGFQYDSCCWSLRVVWERHLTNRFDALGNQSLDEYDSGININFAFKGLGNKGSKRNILNAGLYGYQQPYILGQ